MAMNTEVTKATKGDIPGDVLCLQTMCPDHKIELTNMNEDFLAMKATSDPDTMYMHEAMKEPDAQEFTKAMMKEVNDQMTNGNFIVLLKSMVTEGATIFPAVWQMKGNVTSKPERSKSGKHAST